jgi:lysyl-tRNA synthetase class 2
MAVKTSVPMVVRVGELAGSATPAGQVSVTGRLLFDEGRPRLADGMHTIALAGPQAPQYAWIDVTGEWTGTELRVDTTHVIRAPEESPGTAGIPEALLAREPDRTASIVHNAALLGEVRRFLDLSGFVEVKTPMLQAFPEISFFHQGRTQPMQGTVFHLRTDPEEYLKRFLTAGLDSVYEISTNIRDDADDSTHLTEFQSLEFYRRLMSFESALDLADELIRQVARRLARCIAPRRAGIEAGGPFERIRYAELTQKLTGIDITAPQCQSTAGLAAAIAAAGLHCGPAGSASGWRRDLLDALFDDHVLPQVEQPTWVTHFPVDLAYSYRLDPEDPQSTLRAELYLPGGLEIAHVYENLTVEQDLRARYELRRQHRLDGGLGEVRLNEELLRSMRIGMPPMAGGAIGIERLLMVVLGDKEIGSGVLFGREIARARAADAKRNGETA